MKHLLLVALLAALGTAAGFLFTSRPPAAPTGSAPNSASMSESQKPDASELKRRLSPEQFHVTQQCGTEPGRRAGALLDDVGALLTRIDGRQVTIGAFADSFSVGASCSPARSATPTVRP